MRNFIVPPFLAAFSVATFVLCQNTALADQAVLRLSLASIGGIEAQRTIASIQCTEINFNGATLQQRDTGAAAGRVLTHDISITKVVDQASPQLMQALNSHEVIPVADITFFKSGASTPFEKVTLTNDIVSKIIIVGGDRPHEEITLTFQKILITYQTPNTPPVNDDWDITTAKTS